MRTIDWNCDVHVCLLFSLPYNYSFVSLFGHRVGASVTHKCRSVDSLWPFIDNCHTNLSWHTGIESLPFHVDFEMNEVRYAYPSKKFEKRNMSCQSQRIPLIPIKCGIHHKLTPPKASTLVRYLAFVLMATIPFHIYAISLYTLFVSWLAGISTNRPHGRSTLLLSLLSAKWPKRRIRCFKEPVRGWLGVLLRCDPAVIAEIATVAAAAAATSAHIDAEPAEKKAVVPAESVLFCDVLLLTLPDPSDPPEPPEPPAPPVSLVPSVPLEPLEPPELDGESPWRQ